MANDKPIRPNKDLEKATQALQSRMSSLYRVTYASDETPATSLQTLTTDIQDRIKALSDRDNGDTSSALIRLLTRSKSDQVKQTEKTNKEILEMFQSKSVTDGLLHDFTANRSIQEYDQEIDIVCKYMPTLKRALEILKNATLASDSFSKDILTVTFTGASEEDTKIHAKNFDKMMLRYNLTQKLSDWYDKMSYYGEAFVYIVPYKREIQTLLDNRAKTKKLTGPSGASLMGSIHEMVVIDEAYEAPKGVKDISRPELKVFIDKSGILESGVREYIAAMEKKAMVESLPLRAQYMGIINEVNPVTGKGPLDHTVPDELHIANKYFHDGLVDMDDATSNSGKVNVNGAIIQTLRRENIILIYIGDVCLGYYYFEINRKTEFSSDFSNKLSPRTTMLDDRCQIHNRSTDNKFTDNFVDYIASTIAHQINADFVNKNQDLHREIYALLKHNDVINSAEALDNVKISFIPANDVVHMYFKQDPDSHRGVSDLDDSLLAATFWCCLSLSDMIGQLTRAQDHRVYYVKHTVEPNISQTLMNVINQVKKGNLGLRQIQTMNQVLNIIGQYNDFVVPVGQNGESPIQFEVMEGQRLEPKEELKQSFQDEAIGKIVPPELIQNNADFATQVTSSNIQFIRRVYSRQTILEQHASRILTLLYNYEYGTNIQIKAQLPPPIFLLTNNLNQIYDSVNQMSTNLAQIYYPEAQNDQDEQLKQLLFVKKRNLSQLSTYIRGDENERILQEVELEFAKIKKPNDENNGGF